MIVGILKEIKSEENRVCMTPAGVEVMVKSGHEVLVEKNAGAGSGFADDAYAGAGARMVDTPQKIYASAEMVMHVKEPLPPEYDLIREGQIVFTYLHLAADEPQTRALIKSKAVCIAYETIQKADGSLPLLTPMSEVAGRMAIQEGAKYLEMTQGGHGILLGGVPGVEPATVVVIGGGVVGVNAAKMACGLGAKVYLLDMNLDRLRYLSDVMPANCFTLMSSPATIRKLVTKADVVIGAVLIPGAKAPKLVTRDMLATMKNGSVLVDVAIDQGGCFETSRATTHNDPTFVIDGGGALLRGQHARSGGQDLDAGADQRHLALCPADRQPGLEGSHAGQRGDQEGRQRHRRQDHLQGRGRGLRADLYAYR